MSNTTVPRGPLTVPGTQVRIFENAGVPTNGTSGTYNGLAEKGELLVDVTNCTLYQNTNTQASPTWTLLGTPNAGVNTITSANSVTAVINQLNVLTVGATFTPVISLPAAASNGGLKIRIFVNGSATKTYSFSTNSSTGVTDWVGGTPTYSTTAVPDYFEVESDGTHWHGVVADIGLH